MSSDDMNTPSGIARWLPIGAAVAVLLALGVGLISVDSSPRTPAALDPVEIDDLPSPVRADGIASQTGGGLLDPLLSRVAAPNSIDSDTLSCLIEPHELVDVGTSVAGVLAYLPVQRGDHVRVGDLLARLDDRVERAAVEVARARSEMRSELRAAQARVALGDRKRERAVELHENDALSDQLGEEIETEAQLAQHDLEHTQDLKRVAALQLDQAVEVLERRHIRSPLDGVVVDRMASPGERVEDEPILRIAQVNPLRVEVILPAVRFGEIKPSMRASIRPEIPGDEIHVAEVTVVDPLIDAASGTFRVQLELPNEDGKIPGGLHCDVRFVNPEGT